MNIFDLLSSLLKDGEFSFPVGKDITIGEHNLVSRSNIISGKVSVDNGKVLFKFNQPLPQYAVKVGVRCLASIAEIEVTQDSFLAHALVAGMRITRNIEIKVN